MTTKQKDDIVRLQKEGKGYRIIAAELDLPLNSVKSWCRRHPYAKERIDCCLQCGTEIHSIPHKKPRKFCSDECRLLWWKEHPEKRTSKSAYFHICHCCGRVFTNNRAKADYCCRECFAKTRTKVSVMDKQLYETIRNYKTVLAMIKEIHSSGIITDKDYNKICTILAKKFGLKSSSIFAEIDLIFCATNGNI